MSSPDLDTWDYIGAIDLDCPRVIDASVALCGDGQYRLWYKDGQRLQNVLIARLMAAATQASFHKTRSSRQEFARADQP